MKWKGWERVLLSIPDPADNAAAIAATAIAPLIISASRSTDIPAFYGDWFMARVAAGYVRWNSPFGGSPVYVSFAKARVLVFWSKNPAPFFCHLDKLDRMGFRYYFLLTLNDYETEGLEPGVPPLNNRIETFVRFSQRIGKGRVVWRYDPLILSDTITVDNLLEKIRHIGERIYPFTERLVISFVDIEKYKKVRRNLTARGFSGVREFTENEVDGLCTGIAALNKRWGLTILACGERRDLTRYGIGKGQCINYDLMTKEFSDDVHLMEFLQPEVQQVLTGGGKDSLSPVRCLRDPGQRSTCGCIVSKDIGQYSTCMHLCAYCYANTSESGVRRNYLRYTGDAGHGIFHDTIVL
jgi:DNA repair photolyase